MLIISTMMTGGSLLNSNAQGVTFSGGGAAGATIDCSANSIGFITPANPCLTALAAGTTITCNNPLYNGLTPAECFILNFCPSNLPYPMVCANAGTNAILYAGTSAQVTAATSNSGSTSFLFPGGGIGAGGFIFLVVAAIGIAVLAGLNIFGSGESSEAVHILFIGGMLIGLWFIMSAIEGFLLGNSVSFFTQLNNAFSGIGTSAYIILTLFYTIGVVKAVSRGS